MNTVRVTIHFTGRILGALGKAEEMLERRTIPLPSPFTVEEAKSAALLNLSRPQGASPAYQDVRVSRVAFN